MAGARFFARLSVLLSLTDREVRRNASRAISSPRPYRREVWIKRSGQRSNFTGGIGAVGGVALTASYSHFFHLKIQYGTIAANSIAISANVYPCCHSSSGIVLKFMP
jgi:hypothetical protein